MRSPFAICDTPHTKVFRSIRPSGLGTLDNAVPAMESRRLGDQEAPRLSSSNVALLAVALLNSVLHAVGDAQQAVGPLSLE